MPTPHDLKLLPAMRLTIRAEVFQARLRTDLAQPRTCAWLIQRSCRSPADDPCPLERRGLLAPLAQADLALPFEEATSHPAPGDVLLYGGGVYGEPEILVAYPARFGNKAEAPWRAQSVADPHRAASAWRCSARRTILWGAMVDLEIARDPGGEALG